MKQLKNSNKKEEPTGDSDYDSLGEDGQEEVLIKEANANQSDVISSFGKQFNDPRMMSTRTPLTLFCSQSRLSVISRVGTIVTI